MSVKGKAKKMPLKKKVPLNVYLLKDNGGIPWGENEIIASPIGSGGKPRRIRTDKYLIGHDGAYGTLFIRKPIKETVPEWLKFIAKGLGEGVKTSGWKNKSVSALLLINHKSRQFVVAFGHGRHMIESRLIEDRFGIRVVLNSVSPDKISSIDRQTFDASPRISRTQTVKASSVSDYVINAEQDLLMGLVGFTKSEYSDVLGPLVAGIDSFKGSASEDLSELKVFLAAALERSSSTDYLVRTEDGHSSEFSWVQNLLPVRDQVVIGALEKKLWSSIISSERGNMWLAIPDIVDWSSVSGFSYRADPEPEDIHDVLDLGAFIDTLRSGATLETIKRRDIYMMYVDGRPPTRFAAFKCLYAEIKRNADLFILHAGSWFGVESSFQASVEKYYSGMDWKDFCAPFVEYNHSGEGDYNESVCKCSPNHAMLDRKLIQFGGRYDKIEVCDVYRKPGMNERAEFIHVKRGRGSSNLSHLFAQGLVASTLMVREPDFVKSVNSQFLKQGFPELPLKFEGKGSDVVYAIIDGVESVKIDIPFFSKVTLQNCGKTISSYGYGVKLMHIPESSAQLLLKSEKIAEKKAGKGKAGNKKVVGKKVAAKQAVGKKAAAKQAVGKKAAAKQAVGKKAAAKQAVRKKAAAKQAVGRKAAAKQAVGKKAVAKKAVGKKAVAKKAVAKKVVGK